MDASSSRELGAVIAQRYRIDAALGEGGMGVVMRARHLQLERDVAIKLMRPELVLTNPELAARFELEARSVARLEHPNIVQVIDFGTAPDGSKYIVMQLLVGTSLSALLGKPMSPRRAVDLAIPILRGLGHAHDRGVLHRDIKPENVLVSVDHEGVEQLKLVDFGLAKLLDAGSTGQVALTHAGLVMGTPKYMSPEQARGTTVDARGDLYAVGLLLYEMLAGQAPFDGENPLAVVVMQATQAPAPLPDSVPPALAAVVMRLLAKEPAERYDSADETIAALEQAIAEPVPKVEPIAAAPTIVEAPAIAVANRPAQPAPSSPRRRVRRRRRRWSAVLGVPLFVVGLLAGGLGVWLVAPGGDPSARFERVKNAVARLFGD